MLVPEIPNKVPRRNRQTSDAPSLWPSSLFERHFCRYFGPAARASVPHSGALLPHKAFCDHDNLWQRKKGTQFLLQFRHDSRGAWDNKKVTKDSDQLAGTLETGKTGGAMAGFLADENEFDRRALLRIGTWGVTAVGAVVVAVMANQQSLGSRRDQLAAADLSRQAQQLQSIARESQNETRRLAAAIDTLNSDRDRLFSRVTVLEQGLDSVTGTIVRQNNATSGPESAASKASTASASTMVSTAPIGPAPGADSQPGPAGQAAVPAIAPVVAAAPASTTPSVAASTQDKPHADSAKPEKVEAKIAKQDLKSDPKSEPKSSEPKSSEPKSSEPKIAEAKISEPSKAAEPKASDPNTELKPEAKAEAKADSKPESRLDAKAEPKPQQAAPASMSQAASNAPAPAAPNTPFSSPASALAGAQLSMIGPPAPAAAKLVEPPKPASAGTPPAPTNNAMAAASPKEDEASDAGSNRLAVQRTEFAVDLGTANSVNGLRALWRGLSKSNAELAELRPIIVVREGNTGLGMQLRLAAGPLRDAAAAAKICAALVESQRACETTVFDGQRLAMSADEAQPGKAGSAAKSFQYRRNAPRHVASTVKKEEPPPPPAPPKPPETTTSSISSFFGKR
jgi:hypothetical protein